MPRRREDDLDRELRDHLELDAEEQRLPQMARSLRLRAYTGRGRMRRDLRRLIEEFGSVRIDEALIARGHMPPGGTD